MLGEQIGHQRGQITGTRVLPGDGSAVQVEVSFQASGTLLGIPVNDMGTHVSVARADGTLFGQGQGVTVTDDGEMVAWKGQGAGRLAGHGMAVSWRGAIYFATTSERMAHLEGIAAVFEYDTDETGKSEDKTFEWKSATRSHNAGPASGAVRRHHARSRP